tara:strand:- start:149 stop:613 length:465 start_codon:yes stop_codon:yes gene_type:complete
VEVEIHEGFERLFVSFTIRGTVDSESSKESLRQLYGTKKFLQGANLLADLREAELHLLDLNLMKSYRTWTKEVLKPEFTGPEQGRQRLAIVVSNEADEMVMQLWKALNEAGPDADQRERRIFSVYDDAVFWVGGNSFDNPDVNAGTDPSGLGCT